MKKQVIILPMLLMYSVVAFGQKLNAKGEKMISKIEVLLDNDTTPYIYVNFSYDENNKLIGMTHYALVSGKSIYKKQGNDLTQ